MLKLRHVDSLSVELHAFEPEACPLFARRVTAELYLTAGTHDAMPGQLIDWIYAQEPSYGSMILRIASRCSDPPVCTYFAWRNGKDDAAKGKVSLFIRA